MTINDPIPENALLVDLRDEEDYQTGHLPGAQRLSLQEIQDEAEPEALILLYCYHGMRSLRTALLLKAAGFTNVENLGGIDRYTGALEK